MSFINTLDVNNKIGIEHLPASYGTNPLNENLDANGFDVTQIASLGADTAYFNANSAGGIPQLSLGNSVAGANATTWNVWNASAGAGGLTAPGNLEVWAEYGANNWPVLKLSRDGANITLGAPQVGNVDPQVTILGAAGSVGRIYDDEFHKPCTIVNNNYTEVGPGDAITLDISPLDQAKQVANGNVFQFVPVQSGYYLFTAYIEVATGSAPVAGEFVSLIVTDDSDTKLAGSDDTIACDNIAPCPAWKATYPRRFQVVCSLQGETGYKVKLVISSSTGTVSSVFPAAGISVMSFGPIPSAPPGP